MLEVAPDIQTQAQTVNDRMPSGTPASQIINTQVNHLYNLVSTYLSKDEVEKVCKAFSYSEEAHEGQKRRSGEPYIIHPLAVTYILAQLHADVQTLCAALLHDVIEDTGKTRQELSHAFDDKVAELVDGVSKLSKMESETREQAQAANFRKMVLAMSRDLRVILVKLADRLHNMRTLNVMSTSAQRRIARETLEIYAPIAYRLGMNAIHQELEDLSFAALYPYRYRVLKSHLLKLQEKRAEHNQIIEKSILENLKKLKEASEVIESPFEPYSVYQQILALKRASNIPNKRKAFYRVTKHYHFRLIVGSIDSCYRALGIVHSLFKPFSESFLDHIAIPKANGYQALQTKLFSPYGGPIKISICTQTMHELSLNGITSYGLYRLGSQITQDMTGNISVEPWLNDLVDVQNNFADSIEFLENVKRNLFPDEIYVFTPNGQIQNLPKGATPIDFAYAIHSDVGNHCIAAKVDDYFVPLDSPLHSGETVKIIDAEWARPNPRWLDFTVTARARNHILSALKKLRFDESVELGKQLLDKELDKYQLTVDKLTEQQRSQLVKTFKVKDFPNLLADIGLGNRLALLVANQFSHEPVLIPESKMLSSKPLVIRGAERMVINFARCCRPIPGDNIVGFFNAGKGLTIHTNHCPNILEARHHQPEKLLTVEWEKETAGEFFVDLRLEVKHQRGVLAKISTLLANKGINIETISNESRDGLFSTLRLCISVKNRKHLAEMMRDLRREQGVIKIHRMKN